MPNPTHPQTMRPSTPPRPPAPRPITTKAQARALARNVLAKLGTATKRAPTRPTGADRLAKMAAEPNVSSLDLIKAIHRNGGTRLR